MGLVDALCKKQDFSMHLLAESGIAYKANLAPKRPMAEQRVSPPRIVAEVIGDVPKWTRVIRQHATWLELLA